MKKLAYVFLLLFLVFNFSACDFDSKDINEITYMDLYNANKIDNVLSHYDNIKYTLTDSLDDSKSYSLWISKDTFVMERNNYTRVTKGDKDYYYDKASKEFYRMYNVSDKTYRMNHGDWSIIYNQKGNETITYIQENKDTYSILVELTGETAEKEIAYLTSRKLISNECVMYDIVVDKKTLLAKEFTEYIVDKNVNKKTKCAKVSNITYNNNDSKYIKKVNELEEEFSKISEKNLRTITVIKNVNEENEETIVFKVKKGTVNQMLIGSVEDSDDAVYYKAYLDRECSMPYVYDKNYDGDLTIYLKK